MKWFLSWSLAHPGLLKCPGGPQCPVCTSPSFLQGQGLLEQTALPCTSPIINFPGKGTQLESDTIEIQPSENFREPLGNVSLVLSDQQGYSVDLSCKITHSTDSPDIVPPPDLSWSSSSPLPLALSLSLDCPIVGQNYEKLWRILAYYSETAARLEREIMLSKAPALAYRYKQTPVTDGYYHTDVKASVKAKPEWLLQSAISIRLDRAQSNMHNVKLMYSTRVSAHPDITFYPSLSSPASHPWVMILKNHTNTAVAAVAGKNIHLICDFLSSSNPSVLWILPDGSKLNATSSSVDGRFQVTASGLLVQKAQLADSGLYYCVARAGRDFDVLPLRLVVKDSSVPHSSELMGPPITGTIGDAVTLACKLSGSPEPLASWILPDGNVVWQGLAVSGGFIVHSNGSLSLLTTTQKDTGYYRCIAVNQYGSDTMSTQLILKAHHISALETPFPRGPQSAAGRSTKIPAPSFWQIEEGSGDEEDGEDKKTSTDKRRKPTSLQQFPNRKYLIKKPQRQGRVREGHARRFGELTEQKKHHFQNRHRLTTKKNRIDPQKWAELLAKIRQKTANSTNSQIIAAGNPTTEPIYEGKDKQMRENGKIDGTNRSDGQGKQKEPETEGSSVDDANVKEEQPQPIQPPYEATQTIKATQTIPETENVMERPTDKHVDSEIYAKTQTEKESKHTVTPVNHVTEKEPITLNPLSGTNEIVIESSVLPEQGLKVRTRLQNPQQGLFPNIIPNSRSRSPWITRRKIGQRRRINRPRIQPVPSLQPHSDPVNPMTQKMTFTPAADTIPMLLTMSAVPSTASMLLLRHYVRTAPNSVTLMPLSPTVSDTHIITTSHFASPPLRPSPATPHTYTDTMIHSGKKQITEEPTFNSTPAPTHSTINISEAHVPEADIRAFKQAAQTHTATQTTLGKHAERSPSKHSKELETNVLGESHFSITHSFTESSVLSASSTATSAATITTTSSAAPERASYFGSTKSTPASTTNEDTLPTTTPAAIISPTMSPSTPIIIPISSTPRQTSAFSTSTASPNTMPTSCSTTSPTLTSTTTFRPIITRISIALNPSTRQSSPPVSINAIPKTFTPSFNTTSISTKPTVLTTTESAIATAPPTTIKESTVNMLLSTTTITEVTSTKALPRGTEVTGQFGHPVNGQNKSQTPVDWKNHGANIIPDSHRSRFQLPSSSLPATPRAPVARTRPRIADPHTRTVSVPAESTARLACEAQGEPKPSITWTKVATGAVMSIHSRAQRFGVLPNGTLVIQNIQVQDRGTYICSASSFLGRDRLITSLEVWTRPPHMQLMTYREVTVSQGGQVQLECQADGVPAPLLSWVLPNRSTFTSSSTFSNRIRVDKNGTLNILVALPTDRGLYRCVASNSVGAASASVRLYVSSLPPAIQQPREEHLVLAVGSPLYAHCSARGSPKLTLRWRIPDGTLVRPSQFLHGNLFVLPNGTLHIRSAGSKDAGSYECTASNAVGTSKRTVSVEVQHGEAKEKKTSNSSSFNKASSSVIPSQPSDAFSLTKLSPVNPSDRSRSLSISPSPFNSSSNSAPKINKTVKAYPSHFANIKKADPFSVFSPSTVPTNTTKVSPSVNNTRVTSSSFPDGRKKTSVLHPQPVSPFTKARIVSTSPSTPTVNYGTTLNLYCSVTGHPAPTIIWRTPTKKLVDMNYSFDRRLKVHPNSTLSVQAVTEKDSGEYLCIARNKVSDDYRILRVSVATQPPKIEPKQPVNHMVSFGKPLKVDCQASGLPHPAVRWTLPNGTTVNSVLFEEDRRGQRRQLTVFNNGTLLVPAVGVGEEGEYMCYAENLAGQDTMKVVVKAVRMTPPNFTDDRSHRYIRVRQGETATIPCRPTGDPTPTVTWFSPVLLVIPQSLGSGLYSERIVVVSNGTLEVRSAQRIDSGNYTCRASNMAGVRSMVVSLEVETSSHRIMGQVEKGHGWNAKNPESNHGVVTARNNKFGSNVVITSKVRSNNSNGENNRIRNIVPNTNVNSVVSGSNPTLRSYSQHGFKSPVQGFTTEQGNVGIRFGANEAQNTDIKMDSTELNRDTPSIQSRSGNLDHSQSAGRGESTERNPETNNNEVIAVKKSNDANTSRDNNRVTVISTRGQSLNGSYSGNGAGTSTLRGHAFSRDSHLGGNTDNRGNSVSSSGNSDATLGGGKTSKQRAVTGQTVILPCPYQGYPPLRLAWLLPGNGMLPAPYYGSRLTVHRNGSLELRDVRSSDGGTLMCLVKTERGDALMRVQLEVSEPWVDVTSQKGGEEENLSRTGGLNATQSLLTRAASPLKHLHGGLGMPDTPHSVNSPPSSGSVSKTTVNTRTTPPVSTINGETLRLHCPASQTRSTVSWTTPGGQMLSRGDRGDLGRYLVQEDGTLIIRQVSVFDRGSYTCRLYSPVSSAVSVITVPVIVIAYPPRITTGPSPVTYTTRGVAVELPCLTIGAPRATVIWETPDLTKLSVMGQPRIYGNLYLSPHGSLVIQNPTHRDTGFYRCIAKNVIGVDSKATYLHVM
ncbi:matrix-remodeling-associated protein 5-like [Fundulus diaphanus]